MASIIVVTLEDTQALEKELHQRHSLKRLKVNEIRTNQDYSDRYVLVLRANMERFEQISCLAIASKF